MPALSGEPWRGNARITVSEAAQTAQYAVATAAGVPFNDQANWQGNPGDSFTLTFSFAQGVGLANPYHRATIQVLVPGGSGVGSSWVVTGLPASGDNTAFATRTFHFDDDPLNQTLGAALRAGTLELAITLHREASPDVNNHTINSRGGTGGTPPAGTTFSWARGYLRARSTLSSYARGDVRTGGVPTGPPNGPGATPLFAYRDAIEQRFSTVNQLYRSGSPTFRLLNSGSVRRSQAASAAVQTFDVTALATTTSGLAARINADFTANAVPRVELTLPPATSSSPFPSNSRAASALDAEFVWAQTGHPVGWSASIGAGNGSDNLTLANSEAFATVDGRVSFTQHMQLNDPAFALSKAAASNVRLESQQANIWARSLTARGDGVDTSGAGERQRFTFRDPFAVIKVNDVLSATTTQDGQAGWRETSMTWTDSLPGGTWVLDVSHSDANNTQTQGTAQFSFVLLALDIQTALTATRQGSKDHLIDGATLTVCLSMVRADNGQRLAPTSADVMLLRYTAANGQEHFNGTAWVATGSSAGTWLALTAHPADPLTLCADFDTTGWGYDDILVIGRGLLSGSAFADQVTVEMTGVKNVHSKQAFDPTGLFA